MLFIVDYDHDMILLQILILYFMLYIFIRFFILYYLLLLEVGTFMPSLILLHLYKNIYLLFHILVFLVIVILIFEGLLFYLKIIG